MATIPSATTPCDELPRSINGVSLVTQKGKMKSRYSWEEKLQMLGCNEEQLKAFADLLAPRKTHYSIRRANENDMGRWFEGRGELTLDLIAWHLLGARVPERYPLWIAPRAWDWTQFVAIDVDLRGNEVDFQHRCRQVEEAFRLLDVPSESRLVVPTPSGGRHYYFFTSQKIRTTEIAPTMTQVGIIARKAKFEVFPSAAHGLRTPFGHIPFRPHSADEWLQFIESYKIGRLPTVNWEMCKHLAKEHARSRKTLPMLFSPEPDEVLSTDREYREKPKPPFRSQEHPPDVGMSKADRQKLQRYEKLLSRPVESPADIEQLLDLGIRCEGTRHEAIMRLAWNFVFVRGCKEDDAIREITEWAYRTGEGASKDVNADLEQGSHRVEDDVTELVRLFARLRDNQGTASACLIANEELDAIQTSTLSAEPRLRFSNGKFLIEFLRFAKTNGWPTTGGWECRPAAEGIMRKWPGCSGRRYKLHLDWALKQGILVMTKEKRQTYDRTGCPRTFLLRIPMVKRAAWMLTRDDALARLKQFSFDSKNAATGTASPCEKSDKYHVGFPTKEENNPQKEKASDPTSETVRKETEETVKRTRPNSLTGNGPTGPANEPGKGNDAYAKRPLDPARAAGAGNPIVAPSASKPDCTGNRDARREYPGRAVRHLATGTPECPPIEPALQDIHHSPPGPIPAVPHRRRIGRHDRRQPGCCHRHRCQVAALTATVTVPPGNIDAEAVRRAIAEVKSALATAYPDKKADIDGHPNWPLIEEMALDPGNSARQRHVLLANPMYLAPSELAFRKELIREYRDQRSPPTTAHHCLPTSSQCQARQQSPNPTESLELSG